MPAAPHTLYPHPPGTGILSPPSGMAGSAGVIPPPALMPPFTKLITRTALGIDQKELIGVMEGFAGLFSRQAPFNLLWKHLHTKAGTAAQLEPGFNVKNLSQRDYKQPLGTDSPVRQAEISHQGCGGKEDSQVLGMAVVARHGSCHPCTWHASQGSQSKHAKSRACPHELPAQRRVAPYAPAASTREGSPQESRGKAVAACDEGLNPTAYTPSQLRLQDI